MHGIAVEFVLMEERGDLISLISEGISIYALGVNRIRNVPVPLTAYLRRVRPDIILSAMWPLTSVAVLSWYLSGKCGRLFLSDHVQLSISCIEELKVSPWQVGMLMRLTYFAADGVIAVSNGVKKDLCRLSGLPASKVRVIYNPAAIGEKSAPDPRPSKTEIWGAESNYCILAVGTLKDQKDHATLIRAFALLPVSLKAKLIILGEGPLRRELETLILELNLQDSVTLHGFIVDTYPWYRTADLFVLSSKWEGFGNVIVEALECGVQVVSTDCPSDPAEILQNGRLGRLVPIQDPSALAAGILAAIKAPISKDLLTGRAGDFSVGTISAEYLDYFGVSVGNTNDL